MRLIYFALGWAAGMVIAANTTARPVALWAALFVVACIVFLWNQRQKHLLAVSIVLIGFTLGGLRFAFVPVSNDIAQYNNDGGLTIEGVVTSEPDVRDNRIDLRVEAETVTHRGGTLPTSGLVMVQAPPVSRVQYGDRVRATGVLVIPGQFDDF